MFDEYFEAFLADTPESREMHYRIRYKVYCEEMEYENKNDFSHAQEYDHWDDHSAHFIVKHKESGEWVGAMRLIFQYNQKLPIQQYVILNDNIRNTKSGLSVELSRLCVLKEMRKGRRVTYPMDGIPAQHAEIKESDTLKVSMLHNQHLISRQIIWGLLHAASAYCYDQNITNWYFLTTNAIAKLLRKGGLNLLNIGDACYHRGKRYPFKMNVAETYHSHVWQNGYANEYSLFSSLVEPSHQTDCSQVKSFPTGNRSRSTVRGRLFGVPSACTSPLL